jgi:arylformamidase
MRIHDISQPLGIGTAVWPGDRQPALDWSLRRAAGDAVNVAVVTLSVHTGTHVDGTFHFADDGMRAGALPLDAYIGPAIVVDAVGRAVLDEELLDDVAVAAAPRVLFRTRAHVDETVFPERFAHITPALARRLGAAGVRLVGTDAPSVDPIDSKTLAAHHALGAGGVAILENVVLAGIEPGNYFLVAQPLRLTEADSSPVRALLIEGLTVAAAP